MGKDILINQNNHRAMSLASGESTDCHYWPEGQRKEPSFKDFRGSLDIEKTRKGIFFSHEAVRSGTTILML